ncbi:hypothetical protein BKA65DRAFT_505780 [Rhexocercosporidium sp. MPI-PUGE-AT-0058]|nr:hypothetical protein BKA65DRAFT_505780 [Rhexocercosporidium sp. MPI-PUGE-AT-0058]
MNTPRSLVIGRLVGFSSCKAGGMVPLFSVDGGVTYVRFGSSFFAFFVSFSA